MRRGMPLVTLILIGVNCYFFLYSRTLVTRYQEMAFLSHYALIPDHLQLTALITSMFLHGGWMHLIGNMWFLWIYGSHVEDMLGPVKFFIFYIVCGVAAALVHLMTNLGSPIPTLGASGAIAGVMAGFLLLFPRARVVTLIFIVIFITTVELPAAWLLIYWFAIQLLSGLASFNSMRFADQGNVAWFAHVGGFLAGLLLLRMLGPTIRPARSNYSYR